MIFCFYGAFLENSLSKQNVPFLYMLAVCMQGEGESLSFFLRLAALCMVLLRRFKILLEIVSCSGPKVSWKSSGSVVEYIPCFQSWKDQCSYQCSVCTFSSNSEPGIKIHATSHKTPAGWEVAKKVMHACCLCQTEVNHSSRALGEHVKNQHQMSLKEYYREHVAGNKTLVNVAGLGKLKEEFGDPIPKAESKPEPAKAESMSESVSKPAMPGQYVCEAEGLRCRFCDELFATLQNARDHMDQIHGYPKEKLIAAMDKFTEPEKIMKCTKCPVFFPVEEDLDSKVNQHFANIHSSDWSFEYVELKMEFEEDNSNSN